MPAYASRARRAVHEDVLGGNGFLRVRARWLVGAAVLFGLALSAVGATNAASPGQGPMIEHWNGTAWRIVSSPNLRGIASLRTVTAISATDVWAFGSKATRHGDRALAEHWDGSSWQRVAMPTPSGANEVTFQSSAAGSTSDVWVVGFWAGPKTDGWRTLIERWNGTAWRIVPSPTPHHNAELSGVAVLSPRDAWAVGDYGILPEPHGFPVRTLVLHWNGKRWTRVPSPNPGVRRPHDYLHAVTAASTRSIWAVGTAAGRHHSVQTLVLHWNGRKWRRVPSPNPGDSHLDGLADVASVGRNDVWAVGSYDTRNFDRPVLVEHWNGRTWRAVPAPHPYDAGTSEDPFLVSIAPVSPHDIWAGGKYYLDMGEPASELEKPLLEHWDGHSWSLVPIPSRTDHSWISDIATVSSSNAWAVGSYAG